MVYEFYVTERADYFESMLVDRHVEFERYLDQDSGSNRVLFGVHKRYLKDSNDCNFRTHAHFRTRTIPGKWAGWVLIIVMLSLIILGVIGWVKS